MENKHLKAIALNKSLMDLLESEKFKTFNDGTKQEIYKIIEAQDSFIKFIIEEDKGFELYKQIKSRVKKQKKKKVEYKLKKIRRLK